MKVIKDATTYEAFHHPEGADPTTFPKWLTSAVYSGDVYTDEHDGQTYIKDGDGRFLVSPGDWIVRAEDGSMVPYADDYFRSAFSPVEA